MIAVLILATSIAALVQFFVSYCRSLIAASARVELSEQGREVTGIISRTASAREFHRLLQLVGLCPESGRDRSRIRAVRAYYFLLDRFRSTLGRMLPSAATWVEHEQEGCAYFAAVVLDRRMAYSRNILTQEMAEWR